LTTQKDLVKLRTRTLGPAPLRALRIGLEIVAGADVMEGVLAGVLPDPSRGGPNGENTP
jgi:tetraacyldisaccharide 4'-kinase